MKKRTSSALRSGLFCVAFGMATLSGSATGFAENVHWTMATYAGGHWLDYGMKHFVDLVDKMTDGRVKIDIAQPGTIGSALKVTDAVRSGIAEVGHNWPGYDQGTSIAGAIFGGWSGGLTPQEQLLWFHNQGGDEMLTKWRDEKFGVVSFACAIAETEIFLHSNKPVRTLADFKDLKIRTAGAWAEIASKLGAKTVVISGAEVYSALERHVVDAVEWGGPALNLSTGFQNIAKYIIVPGIHQPSSVQECMFNKAAWAKLSKEDQEHIKLAAKLNTYDTFAAYGEEDIDGWNKITSSKKNEVVHLDPSFIKAAREASFQWAEDKEKLDPWFKTVYESQRKFQKRLSRWHEFRIPIGSSDME